MIYHSEILSKVLGRYIRNGEIAWGGNIKLKIYGKLNCTSGKRLKVENRVFFNTEKEANQLGYRPCGNCLKQKYLEWKK
jgi:methylphosphotriester-DNA--protein-cysteine methyltransferase